MTSPYVTAPPSARPAAWRVVLVVLSCVLAPPAAAIAAFVAALEWSGCFIECSTPQPDNATAGALALLAGGLLLLGPVLAWLLLRSGRAVLLAVGGVLATLLTGAFLAGVA